ncbi:hypothetical protein H1D32_05940 [Anaerobacillus sp. CMMVII]|uniref:hypothetical protein n=1 Tax=Anaerobacillus sp. CMMVII TaxID=2755588 RepID=UPI0021B76F39|nr:hypothetical protein [Anaerobacillus sp. CMMVII]MCT8137325.1 hypothetical protein [Anaerobacillus sp. CMMVII]
MKLKLVLLNLSILLAVILITGCGGITKEQAIESAKEAFETGVVAEPQAPNEQTDMFSYYLPSTLSLEEVSENNLILSKGNQLYLVFSNPAETKTSQVNYEQDKVLEENTLLLETLEVDGAFSYIIVSPFEEDEYKVIVGIGGEKGTTITDLENLKDSVDTMLEIIKSINY